MRNVTAIITAIVIGLIFTSCSTTDSGLPEHFGFSKSAFTIVDEEDTHGGFHGDGSYYLILDCSEKPEQATELIKGWKQLPLSENLQLII